jgi:hypothetical protein
MDDDKSTDIHSHPEELIYAPYEEEMPPLQEKVEKKNTDNCLSTRASSSRDASATAIPKEGTAERYLSRFRVPMFLFLNT